MIFFFSVAIISVAVAFLYNGEAANDDDIVSKEEIKKIDDFIRSIKERDKAFDGKREIKRSGIRPALSQFNPNTADSIELSMLGIPKYVVSNILKYRKAGGAFRDASSLSKIYGLKQELFKILEPYIVIPSNLAQNRDSSFLLKKTSFKSEKYDALTKVDLNKADTSELKKIPGIGSGLARMIIGYRERLGGYYSVEQLDDIGYVDRKLYEWFTVVTPISADNMINVNEASLDKLRNHPYMNFYKAKVIVEYRRKRGKIKNLSQLSLFEEFSEKDLMRLSNYLSFD